MRPLTSEEAERLLEVTKEKQRAFRQALLSPAGQFILQDLKIFCRANESCAVPGDHDRTMLLLGRNEVWLRLMEMIELTTAELVTLRSGGEIRVIDEQGDEDA